MTVFDQMAEGFVADLAVIEMQERRTRPLGYPAICDENVVDGLCVVSEPIPDAQSSQHIA